MKKRIVFALVTAFVLLVPAGIASAGQNDVIREGSCAGASDWKLKVSPENGRLEVEFEVDQNVSGDRWRVRIRHDGDLAFAASEPRWARAVRSRSGSSRTTRPGPTPSEDALGTCPPTRCAWGAPPSSSVAFGSPATTAGLPCVFQRRRCSPIP